MVLGNGCIAEDGVEEFIIQANCDCESKSEEYCVADEG